MRRIHHKTVKRPIKKASIIGCLLVIAFKSTLLLLSIISLYILITGNGLETVLHLLGG